MQFNLNTSHVKVKLGNKKYVGYCNANLNTSHVKVKPAFSISFSASFFI